MFRLLVTGSQHLTDPEFVWLPLWQIIHKHEAMILVHGDCPTGADAFAQQWIDLPGQQWNTQRIGRLGLKQVERLVVPERHPAKWDQWGKNAGRVRNQQMVSEGADACIGFPMPNSRGTYDCMARAVAHGIPTWMYSTSNLGAMHKVEAPEAEKLMERYLS